MNLCVGSGWRDVLLGVFADQSKRRDPVSMFTFFFSFFKQTQQQWLVKPVCVQWTDRISVYVTKYNILNMPEVCLMTFRTMNAKLIYPEHTRVETMAHFQISVWTVSGGGAPEILISFWLFVASWGRWIFFPRLPRIAMLYLRNVLKGKRSGSDQCWKRKRMSWKGFCSF